MYRQWPLLLATMIGMIAAVLYMYTLGAFVQPMQATLGWSRAQISSAVTAATLATTVFYPLAGLAIDRFGPRRVALIGLPTYTAIFACIPFATGSIWMWWLAWGLLGVTNSFTGPSVWTSAVAVRFTRNRGLALAIALCGTSIGSFVVPVCATWLIAQFGWRLAFSAVGLIFGLAALLVTTILPRHAPVGQNAAPTGTWSEARGLILSAPFILLTLAIGAFTLVSSAMVLSAIPILTAQGISPLEAAGISGSMGFTAIIGRLGNGYLVDRIQPRMVAVVALTLPVVSSALLLVSGGSIPLAILAMLVFGLALGAEFDTVAVFVSRLFPLRQYGLLFNVLFMGVTICSAIAPVSASRVYDLAGSYTWVLLACIPLNLLSGFLMFLVGPVPPSHGE